MKLRKKIIPLSLALAFSGPTAVLAGPVEMFALAEWALGPGSTLASPTDSQRDPVAGTSNTNVDVLRDVSDGSGNNMFFHPYGYSNGGYNFFGTRASGGGHYAGTSTFHLGQEETNTGSTAAPYLFNFIVDSGNVGVGCAPCTGGGTAMVNLAIRIDRDINDGGAAGFETLAEGAVSLIVNGDGTWEFSRSGLAASFGGIGANASNGTPSASVNEYFSWSDTAFSLALGDIDAGKTFRLEYDLIAKATGAFTGGSVECASYGGFDFRDPANEGGIQPEIAEGGGVNVANPEGGGYCTGWLPGTEARAGDPGGLQRYFQPASFGITAATPEPASTALLGLGLGAALLAGRRRKKKPA